MPRAFLLKRTTDEISSSSNQKTIFLTNESQDPIRERKREKLSKMIDEIKLAIKREDNSTTKNVVQKRRGFSVAHILKPENKHDERRFESEKSAFFIPAKRKYYRVYEEDYGEFFDFSAGPIKNKRIKDSYLSSTSPTFQNSNWCTKSCCRRKPVILQDENDYISKRSGNERGGWISPDMSSRLNETSSTDSYDSGSNTVNKVSNLTKNRHSRDFVKVYDNKFLKQKPYCACTECTHGRQYVSRYSHYKHHHEKPSPKPVIRNIDLTKSIKNSNKKTVSRRRALLNEIENELSMSKRDNIEQEPIKTTIKSAADILTIPPGTNRSRAMANLLERRRVAELNSAFENLRKLVPLYGNEDRALSKIKTLRYAMTYIQHLSLLMNSEFTDMSRYLNDLSVRDSSVEKFYDNLVKRKVLS